MFKILGLNFGKIRYATRSPRWKKIRKDFLAKNKVCAACGSSQDLEAHHIIPVHIDPNLELDSNNLIALCSKSCHLLIGHLMDFRSWNPSIIRDAKNLTLKIKSRPYKK